MNEQTRKIIFRILQSGIPISSIDFEGPNIVLNVSRRGDYSKQISVLTKELNRRFVVRCSNRAIAEYAVKLISEYGLKVADINKDVGEIYVYSDNPRSVRRLSWLVFAETGWRVRLLRTPAHGPIPETMKKVNLLRSNPERRKYLRDVAYRYVFKMRVNGDKYLRLVFAGGAGCIGRSAIVVDAPEARILLDYGGDPRDPRLEPRLDIAGIPPQTIDAIVVSHAHLDHIAMLPRLVEKTTAPIYVPEATQYLAAMEFADFLRVARQRGNGQPYPSQNIDTTITRFITQPPGLALDILPGTTLTFHRAGHILGSAITHLVVDGVSIVYTGDIRYADTGIHKSMRKLPRADVLIIEATYGGKTQPSRREAYAEIRRILRRHVSARRGVVLFPALTVGRAQEILWFVWKTIKEERLPVPHIFLDGLARETTMIYTAYPEELTIPVEELAEALDYTESTPANERGERLEAGSIVIAGHGMLQGGPALDYFKYIASSEDNAVVLTSFQAPGTLGAELASGKRTIALNGKVVTVKASIYRVEGLSAHADQPKLLEIAMKVKPKIAFVVHGENGSIRALVRALREVGIEAVAPRPLEARTIYANV